MAHPALVDRDGVVHVWDGCNGDLYSERWTLCEDRRAYGRAIFTPMALSFVEGNFAVTCFACLVRTKRP